MSKGLVLPEGTLHTTEGVTFPGFPGVWFPGVPIALFDMGLDEDDANKRVEELGLPLEPAEVEPQRQGLHEPVTSNRSTTDFPAAADADERAGRETVKGIADRIGAATPEQLDELAQDDRAGVQKVVERERARRAELAAGGDEG